MKAKKHWVLSISIGLFIAASPWVVVGAETKSEIGDVEGLQAKIKELEQTVETQEKVITELKATCEELKEKLKLQITENGKLKALSENRQKKTFAEPEESQQQEPVLARRKARWANADCWKQLTGGEDESTVRRLLGEPKCIQCGSEGSTWYYLSVPDSPRPGSLEKIRGYVSFKNKSTNPARDYQPPYPLWKHYTVSIIRPPIWDSLDANSIYEAEIGEKSTLERRREKWEDSSNWRKLKMNMRQNEVRSLLGEPREGGGKWAVWIYTPGSERGVSDKLGRLVFDKERSGDTYLLYSWEEPFWPAVERGLQKKEK